MQQHGQGAPPRQLAASPLLWPPSAGSHPCCACMGQPITFNPLQRHQHLVLVSGRPADMPSPPPLLLLLPPALPLFIPRPSACARCTVMRGLGLQLGQGGAGGGSFSLNNGVRQEGVTQVPLCSQPRFPACSCQLSCSFHHSPRRMIAYRDTQDTNLGDPVARGSQRGCEQGVSS